MLKGLVEFFRQLFGKRGKAADAFSIIQIPPDHPAPSTTPMTIPEQPVSEPVGQMPQRSLAEKSTAAVSALEEIETAIVSDIKGRIALRVAGQWNKSDDDLFELYTGYAAHCWRNLIPERATATFIVEIVPLIDAADAQLAAEGNPVIHRGSPLYNSAVCFFLAGDFDHAYQYFSESGVADERLGRGDAGRVLIGDHPLSEQLLVRPIVAWGKAAWEADYRQAIGSNLELVEMKSLLSWLATRLVDAMQLVIALHKLARVQTGPDNDAAKHLRLRDLADVVLVIESSLRRWQVIHGELHARLHDLLGQNGTSQTAFDNAHNRFTARWLKPDRVTAAAVNWVVDDCLQAFDAAPNTATKCGIACYLALRLRNSLMHVLDEDLDLYSNRAKVLRATGLMMAVVRASQHGNEGTLAAI